MKASDIVFVTLESAMPLIKRLLRMKLSPDDKAEAITILLDLRDAIDQTLAVIDPDQQRQSLRERFKAKFEKGSRRGSGLKAAAGALFLLALLAGAAPTMAQATINLSAASITNQQPGASPRFLYGIGGEFCISKACAGLDVMGDPTKQNPRELTRGRAFATWDTYRRGEWLKVRAGGGAAKTGNDFSGFARLELLLGDRFRAFTNYGSRNTLDADGFFAVFNPERAKLGVFYRYYRNDDRNNVQLAGVRAYFK